MLKYALPVALLSLSCTAASLVDGVRSASEQNDYARAAGYIQSYESRGGQTPESILALSWMARTALEQKKYVQADRYAQDTYQRALKEMKKGPLDREPYLPLALGASIEVQAQVLAVKGQRTEAISMLEDQLKKYSSTSIHARIQKNINLLSLKGKPAPPLQALSLPKGKPALLFFWAHWCSDCKAEEPVIARLQAELPSRDFVVVAPTQRYGYAGAQDNISPEQETQYIEAVRQRYYAQLSGDAVPVSKENFDLYGASTTPTIVLIARNGKISLYHPGAMPYGELRPEIEKLISAK